MLVYSSKSTTVNSEMELEAKEADFRPILSPAPASITQWDRMTPCGCPEPVWYNTATAPPLSAPLILVNGSDDITDTQEKHSKETPPQETQTHEEATARQSSRVETTRSSVSIQIQVDSDLSVPSSSSLSPAGGAFRPRSTVEMFTERFLGSSSSSLLEFVRMNVQGRDAVYRGPFGEKRIIYCDYTASGKPLEFIERFIQDFVHPFYGNTHTTSNICSLQTTQFRNDARAIIRNCVNASEDDAVIFCGSGTTAAIHKLIHAIQLEGEKAKNTVIIVGPFEHHSNILPWKETGAQVIRVKDTSGGLVDLKDLRRKLHTLRENGSNIIGAFSATSNVTGILVDTTPIAEIIHKYGGISVWDYATGAPYLKIDMNTSELGYKDAVFCSPHKFVGGVGTPGILIAKKKLFVNPIPGGCGGGTVVYVTHETHTYVGNIEDREEGGTPAIVESIRAGLVFQLKQNIGEDTIAEKDDDLCNLAFSSWKRNVNIHILGSHTAKRLPIFALLFRNPESGKLLHHNFVATLLNDLYGIQVRGGCACAGPYTQDILGIAEDMAQRFSWFLTPPKEGEAEIPGQNLKILKPGFVRLNFPFFLEREAVEFIIHAVDMIATLGWKLLPFYTYNYTTGDWKHRNSVLTIRRLYDIIYDARGASVGGASSVSTGGRVSFEEVANVASETLENALTESKTLDLTTEPEFPLEEDQRHMIWFLLPTQALMYLRNPILKHLTFKHMPLGFDPPRNTLKRVKRRFRTLIVNSLGEMEARQMEFLRKTSIFDNFGFQGNTMDGSQSIPCSPNPLTTPNLLYPPPCQPSMVHTTGPEATLYGGRRGSHVIHKEGEKMPTILSLIESSQNPLEYKCIKKKKMKKCCLIM